jgi:hypothetical protein
MVCGNDTRELFSVFNPIVARLELFCNRSSFWLSLIITGVNIDERLRAIAESLELLTHDVRPVSATVQNIGKPMPRVGFALAQPAYGTGRVESEVPSLERTRSSFLF